MSGRVVLLMTTGTIVLTWVGAGDDVCARSNTFKVIEIAPGTDESGILHPFDNEEEGGEQTDKLDFKSSNPRI